MARLTTYDDPISRCLAEARFALMIEHDCTGDYFGPKTPKSEIRDQKFTSSAALPSAGTIGSMARTICTCTAAGTMPHLLSSRCREARPGRSGISPTPLFRNERLDERRLAPSPRRIRAALRQIPQMAHGRPPPRTSVNGPTIKWTLLSFASGHCSS